MPVSSLRSAPCSPPARMSNTCYLTACGPVGLGEAQKASLALPAAALVAYLNQPLPQHSTQNYCLYLICSPNAKLSQRRFFPFSLSKDTLTFSQCLLAIYIYNHYCYLSSISVFTHKVETEHL